jgi:predicted metal-dependent HD superfamily phosphohydrolase
MSNDLKQILDQAIDIINGCPDSRLYYHAAWHTYDVFRAASEISKYEALDHDEKRNLLIAAAFHDTGFCDGHENHEEKSIEIMRRSLPDLSDSDLSKIECLIMATRTDVSPRNKSEAIIKDADLDYLGRKDYDEISELLYKEFTEFNRVTSKDEWLELQLIFLNKHEYYSEFSKKFRVEQKLKNIHSIRIQQAGQK